MSTYWAHVLCSVRAVLCGCACALVDAVENKTAANTMEVAFCRLRHGRVTCKRALYVLLLHGLLTQ